MNSFVIKSDYKPIEDVDGHEEPRAQLKFLPWLSSRYAVVTNLVLFLASIACLCASLYLNRNGAAHCPKDMDRNSLLRSTVYYSPIQAQIPFRDSQFVSAPLSSKNESIYRQPPSAEVDAAWERLADIGTHILSSDDIRKLGKDPKKAVRVPSDWGYGDDAHIATIDGIHLVHCLNSMRKNLHINYAYYHATPPGPEYVPHLTHCVESVLQHLMCQPSMEFLTQNWIERQHLPFPDFAINKKCWDYEAILRWKEEHRVLDIEARFNELRPPPDAVIMPLPPLVAETWEIIDGQHNHTT